MRRENTKEVAVFKQILVLAHPGCFSLVQALMEPVIKINIAYGYKGVQASYCIHWPTVYLKIGVDFSLERIWNLL